MGALRTACSDAYLRMAALVCIATRLVRVRARVRARVRLRLRVRLRVRLRLRARCTELG